MRANAHRDQARVFTDPTGAATIILGRGLANRTEVAIEIDPNRRNQGIARQALTEARRIVGADQLLFAQTAPGQRGLDPHVAHSWLSTDRQRSPLLRLQPASRLTDQLDPTTTNYSSARCERPLCDNGTARRTVHGPLTDQGDRRRGRLTKPTDHRTTLRGASRSARVLSKRATRIGPMANKTWFITGTSRGFWSRVDEGRAGARRPRRRDGA